MKKPLLSVIMPVYNAQEYLSEAIESVLKQTFNDFEFLILNDGSSDGSLNIMQSYSDPRIKVIHSEKNTGIVSRLNAGLKLARGQFIARMDADDVSHPMRFQKQIDFLKKHPQTIVCGTAMRVYYGTRRAHVIRYVQTPEQIKALLLFDNPVAHPTVMFRKNPSIFYREAFHPAEDYDLWTRLVLSSEIRNLKEVLLNYRMHPDQATRQFHDKGFSKRERIWGNYLKALGFECTASDVRVHSQMRHRKLSQNLSGFKKIEKWLLNLKSQNSKFEILLGQQWLEALQWNPGKNLQILIYFWKSPLRKLIRINVQAIRVLLRALLKQIF